MKIISLSSTIAGPACAIATIIKKKFYNDNYKTNIFDYLEISFDSIIEILEIKNNIDFDRKIKENYEIILNKTGKNSVYFKNFNKIISHHDLITNHTEVDFEDFINKYKRRYDRLFNTINEENKIFFIRFGIEEKDKIEKFINEVNKINKELIVYFINVYYDDKCNCLYEIDNYYPINFFNYIDYNKKYNDDPFYKTLEFNWDYIFDIIKNNLSESNN